MNRFFVAIEAFSGPDILPLSSISDALAQAVREVETEGGRPDDDPAVLLLGVVVSFRTHADVNTNNGLRRLLDLCQHRIDSRGMQ
jgi:hypothetical protein